MKTAFALICLLGLSLVSWAGTPSIKEDLLLAQVKQMDTATAPPRVMGLYEQGWDEGAHSGDRHSGKVGWFLAGFGNVPLLWLPWVVEPRRPAKPSVMAEEEYNSGFRHGYRAGWKNSHKVFYIAGTIVETAVVAGILASQD